MLEIYLTGSYVSILIMAILLENSKFLDYAYSISETFLKVLNFKDEEIALYQYCMFFMVYGFCGLFSWLGCVIPSLLFKDFLTYKKTEDN